MSVFSDIFADGMQYLSEASGEDVIYIAPNGEEKAATAIVGNETLVEEAVPDAGKVWKRKRDFTFQLSKVNPIVHGAVVYLNEEWHISGEASRSLTNARVTAESSPIHERTRGSYRGR